MSRGAQGLRAWLMQRVTAVYLGLFSLYLVTCLLIRPPADYAQWSAWVGAPLVTLGFAIYIISVLLHAWVGVRDVLIDYVHPVSIRLTLLALLAFLLLACGLWAMRALLVTAVI